EQIAEHGYRVPGGLFEKQRRSLLFQRAVADLRHLEPGIDRGGHALQLAARLELRHEIAQVRVAHLKMRMRKKRSTTIPTQMTSPTQLLLRKALKQPSRVRSLTRRYWWNTRPAAAPSAT